MTMTKRLDRTSRTLLVDIDKRMPAIEELLKAMVVKYHELHAELEKLNATNQILARNLDLMLREKAATMRMLGQLTVARLSTIPSGA